MERQTIDITERAFVSSTAQSCKLSLLVGLTGLDAVVAKKKKVIGLRGWHFDQPNHTRFSLEQALRDLNTVLATEPIFDYAYKEVSIFLVNPWATLVPNRLFSAAAKPKQYLNLLTLPDDDLQVSTVQIPEVESHIVYGIEREMLNLLKAKFQNVMFSHTSHALLLAWTKMKRGNEPQVFLNVCNRTAQMAVFNRGNLQFFNTFSYSNPSDFLYFTLLPFSELNIDPLQAPLMISGEMVEFSPLHKILMRYMRNIMFAGHRLDLDLPGSVQSLPDHFNFDLFSGI